MTVDVNSLGVNGKLTNFRRNNMDRLLKELACFGCKYSDDCDEEWTEGFCICDHMMEKAKDFAEKMNIDNGNLAFPRGGIKIV